MTASIQSLIMSPSNIVIFFCILTIVLHIFLVKYFPQSKKFWKYMNYICLIFAAFGIIYTAYDIRTMVAQNLHENASVRTEFLYKDFRNFIGTVSPPPYICREFIKSEFSPENFDEIVSEYNFICDWNKNYIAQLPQNISDNFPDIPFSPPKKEINDPMLQEYFRDIQKKINVYYEQREEMSEYKLKMSRSPMEEFLFFLSPIFLCIAIALQFTKVSAE